MFDDISDLMSLIKEVYPEKDYTNLFEGFNTISDLVGFIEDDVYYYIDEDTPHTAITFDITCEDGFVPDPTNKTCLPVQNRNDTAQKPSIDRIISLLKFRHQIQNKENS